jgi:hypothetical protein
MSKKEHIDWENLLRQQVEGAPKILWNNTSKKDQVYNIRYKMKPADIMTFVSGLHNVQMDMIETAVMAKEKQGFPEASAVIDHIRGLK